MISTSVRGANMSETCRRNSRIPLLHLNPPDRNIVLLPRPTVEPKTDIRAALLRRIRPSTLKTMRFSSMKRLPFFAVLWAMTLLSREPATLELRLGQRIYVDDGTCPQGQVKEVTGSRLTPTEIGRASCRERV